MNGIRDLYYHLPPILPSDATMASLDVTIEEKYFDTDKALTLITTKVGTMPDSKRWVDEFSATDSVPAVPPDCTDVRVNEIKTGTLWRDGVKYVLHFYTLKASARRLRDPDAKVALATESEYLAFPAKSYGGQICHEVPAPSGSAAANTACMWDRFPYAGYLNWPFALSGRIQFGPDVGPGATLFQTIETLVVERDKAIATTVFDVPAGFSVTGLD